MEKGELPPAGEPLASPARDPRSGPVPAARDWLSEITSRRVGMVLFVASIGLLFLTLRRLELPVWWKVSLVMLVLLASMGGVSWLVAWIAMRRRKAHGWLYFSLMFLWLGVQTCQFLRDLWPEPGARVARYRQQLTAELGAMEARIQNGGLALLPGPRQGDQIHLSLRPLFEMVDDHVGFRTKLQADIRGLERGDLFSSAVVRQPAALQLELRKREALAKIVEDYQKRVVGRMEEARQQTRLANVPPELKQIAADSFELYARNCLLTLERPCEVTRRVLAAEAELLRHLIGWQGDFEFAAGVATFTDPAKGREYARLREAVRLAESEAKTVSEQARSNAGTSRQSLRNLP